MEKRNHPLASSNTMNNLASEQPLDTYITCILVAYTFAWPSVGHIWSMADTRMKLAINTANA